MLRVAIVLSLLAGVARAQPAEPTGKHPRILLDDTLRAAWKDQAKQADSPVSRAIARCEATRKDPKEYARDSYMGFDWNASIAACLIAYVVRGNDADAKSAMIYVAAMLDDLEYVGDGKGGEKAVRRDTGYAIRSMPAYVALAYDWLHDHPAMTAGIKQKIHERMEQWLTWYRANGYKRSTPATNYHAGWLWSATLAAIAFGGDGPFWSSLWTHVRDDIWGKDMARALGPGGIFEGGDFPEGWQYAPLSVAEYAFAARIAAPHGIKIDGVDKWLQSMLVRTIHARSGARDTITPIGDVEDKTASIAVQPMTLLAILIGPATEIAQKQAAGVKQRLKLVAKDHWVLFEAIAEARAITPVMPAFDKWPTSYYTPGLHTLYARTSWAKDGVWMATICMNTPNEDADHLAPMAGNLIVTRGVDEVIVDPTPYGSLSTLTSNAPTVDAKRLPDKYRPSQASWGEATHHVWALQTQAGVIAARCNYADQFKFQEKSTDVDMAMRDVVLVPWGKDRADASIVVVDRADTGSADLAMYLRFRTPIAFGQAGDVATAKVGASTLSIYKVSPQAIKGETRIPQVDACWNMDRGKCDTARFPVGEYRIQIPGPTPAAIHVLDVSGGDALAVEQPAAGVVHLRRGAQDAWVSTKPGSYTGTPGIHVSVADGAKLTVTKDGAKCKVDITADGPKDQPAIVVVDAQCKAVDDTKVGPAAPDLAGSAAGTLIPVGSGAPRAKSRGGCCDASGGAGSAVLALLSLAFVFRRVNKSP